MVSRHYLRWEVEVPKHGVQLWLRMLIAMSMNLRKQVAS